MKYKKKQGSSLVLVIGVVAILVVLLGIVSKAILSTTRLNQTTKDSEDLIYAAESGIEIGVSRIIKNKKLNSNWEPTTESDKKIIVSESEFNSNSISIYAEINNELDDSGAVIKNRYKITSKAKNNKGEEKIVNATMGQHLGGHNIFENVICANDVNMNNGALHALPGYMNMVNSSNINSGSSATDKTNSPFTLPNYTFEKVADSNKTIKVELLNDLLSELDRLEGQGVRKITVAVNSNGPFRVYLVNSDKLEIEFTKKANQASKTENKAINFMIISNGDVKFKLDGSMHWVNSCVISKSFEVVGRTAGQSGGITMNYSPFGIPGHSPLDKEKVDFLNSEISKYAPNWSENSSLGSIDTNYWGTIEYEY